MTVRELVVKINYKTDQKSLDNAEKKVSKFKQGLKRFALIAGSAILGIGAAAIKTASDMEAMTAQFEVMLGSADKAKELVKDLVKFSAATPFQLKDLSAGAKTLLNFGVAGEEVIPIMRTLGDVAGGNSERMKTLALVFGQVRGLGKLQGQDWRQLVNAGFNPLESIAKRTGKTMGELQQEMSKGLISFDDLKTAFKDATSEGGRFYQNMLKASQTVAGVFSTLKDNVVLALGEAVNELLPQIKEGMLKIIPIVQNTLKPLVTNLVKALLPIAEVFIKLLEPMLQFIMPVFKTLADVLGVIGRIIDKSVMPFINSLFKTLTPVLQDILDLVSELLITLEPMINLMMNLFAIVVKKALLPIVFQLKILMTILRPIIKLLDLAFGPLVMVLLKLSEIINQLIDDFSAMFDLWIDNGIEKIKEKFAGIADIFKTISQTVREFFINTINWIIDKTNFLIEKINELPGVTIKQIQKFEAKKDAIDNITNNTKKVNANVNVGGLNIDARQTGGAIDGIEKATEAIFNVQLQKILTSAGY